MSHDRRGPLHARLCRLAFLNMFVRAKTNRHGHRRHQLVRSVRIEGTVRQEIVAYLGDAASASKALQQWAVRITDLHQRAAELRSAAERIRAQMPPVWLAAGMVPRPSRWGMRAANRAFGRYWATWDRATRLDRKADRLQGRKIVEHKVGTTPAADDPLGSGVTWSRFTVPSSFQATRRPSRCVRKARHDERRDMTKLVKWLRLPETQVRLAQIPALTETTRPRWRRLGDV